MTQLEEDLRDRLVSYIQHQATKDTASVRELVDGAHRELIAKLDSLSDEQARFKPAPDIWCALEVMAHVVTAKRGTARLCEMLARGEQPKNFGGEGEDLSSQDGISRGSYATVAEAREAAQKEHDALLSFIDRLDSGELDQETRYKHFIFGALNCREWACFQRVHDGDHLRQIDQIIAAEEYPA